MAGPSTVFSVMDWSVMAALATDTAHFLQMSESAPCRRVTWRQTWWADTFQRSGVTILKATGATRSRRKDATPHFVIKTLEMTAQYYLNRSEHDLRHRGVNCSKVRGTANKTLTVLPGSDKPTSLQLD